MLLLDSCIDVLQHVLVKVFVPVDSLQILLELLSTRTKDSERLNSQTSELMPVWILGANTTAWVRAHGFVTQYASAAAGGKQGLESTPSSK